MLAIHGEMRVCSGDRFAERRNDLQPLTRKRQLDLVWDLFVTKVDWRAVDRLRVVAMNNQQSVRGGSTKSSEPIGSLDTKESNTDNPCNHK